jgi:hypothetical protein
VLTFSPRQTDEGFNLHVKIPTPSPFDAQHSVVAVRAELVGQVR